ncbi:HAD family hydrolase [Clostridium novyi B str. ATCC 27606]|uniref:HAD family hydrolase n=2 Tax=Clostridium TaxID=1485 RepID=A0AA40IT80_CLONO|nr:MULTISPECIES: sugar-phosphatase [Clostridium]KEI14249.1 HAD family hydrolase [Clostridium novyi B str. NCTC 9691]KEI14685.1 HAD family hydrolase [Clostridium novyi B str. ATCC 27606]KEI17952.1 HAD family hydrolase [Clostridium haemolyticum NCTC 9693]KGN01584.1 HAD family hydrolase [Clostridium haemolyticum NCTC 8350]OOB76153.1 HAD family hydrolase [Clostridium haemolyticum]
MYKLIALDMDGTLLNSEHLITEKNKEAIKKANEEGVKVVLATGRMISGIESYLEELNLNTDNNYCVTCNGAIVVNAGTKEILSKIVLGYEDLCYLNELSKKLDVYIHAVTPTKSLVPKMNEFTEKELYMNKTRFEEIPLENADKSVEVIKVLFVGPKEKIASIMHTLPKEVYEKYTVVRSHDNFLEFLDKRINKGFGVKCLGEKLHINKEEIICVGDAENDLHMIEYAGLGVAMDNAFPDVKKAADFVTYSNNESGVAHVINKFILNKNH